MQKMNSDQNFSQKINGLSVSDRERPQSKYPYRRTQRTKIRKTVLSVALASILASFLVIGLGGFAVSSASGTSGTSYNNVQVFLQTQNSTDNFFILGVYNSTGTLIAGAQSQYPAFSFELPEGNYIFATTAISQSSQYPYWGSSYPSMEYGYLSEKISGATSLNLATQKISDIPQTKIAVQVNYANGSAASGASVSAATLGSYYWWGNNFVMWNQTGPDGSTTLTVPSVPVEISAWAWVLVNLPTNQTTVQTTVAGEPVNVTVYWQPMYVGLSGSGLVVPPQSSAQITLHYTPQRNYCYYPYGEGVAYATGTAKAVGASSQVNSGYAQPSGIASIPCIYGGGPVAYGASVRNGAPQPYSGPQNSGPFIQYGTNGIVPSTFPPANQVPVQNVSNTLGSTTAIDTELTIGIVIAISFSAISLLAVLLNRRIKGQKTGVA